MLSSAAAFATVPRTLTVAEPAWVKEPVRALGVMGVHETGAGKAETGKLKSDFTEGSEGKIEDDDENEDEVETVISNL